jgi:hypothetical protein
VADGQMQLGTWQGVLASIFAAEDLNELHFESSHFDYLYIPSFPFVKIVEGSQQWH